jgi:outer membrane immunogenic protein
MSLKLRAALAAASLILLMGPAYAQCHGGAFEGPYIGANLGFGRADTTQSSPGDPSVSGDDSSVTAGGQVGYNRQCGHVVFGIEADFNYLGFETNTTPAIPVVVNLKDEINWFGTVRGRVGVVVDNHALLYATGGLAYADTSHTFSVPSFPFRQTDDDFKTGWTIGGGIELVHDVRWLLRAEVLYVDLGDNTHTYTATTGCGANCTGTANWDDSFWVARLGLSYKFGVREPVVPLK